MKTPFLPFADSIGKLSLYFCGSPVMCTTVFFLSKTSVVGFWSHYALEVFKRSGLKCTLQAAHFSLAFSLLLLQFMPKTWKTHRNYCPVHPILITIVFFPLSVLKIEMTHHCLMEVVKIRQTLSKQVKKQSVLTGCQKY